MKKNLELRRRMLADERLAQACHESSHALAMLRLGVGFKTVMLCDEEVRGGNYALLNARGITVKRVGCVVPTDEVVRRGEEWREAQTLMAGLAFEKILRPGARYSSLCMFGPCESDYRKGMEWVSLALYDDTHHTGADVERVLFRELLPPARKLVVEDWCYIAAVGKLLAAHGQLSQSEVEAVLDSAGGFGPNPDPEVLSPSRLERHKNGGENAS